MVKSSVVAMHEQAKALLQMMPNGDHTWPSSTAWQAENRTSSSGMSVLDHLKSDVREALDQVDAEERDLRPISVSPYPFLRQSRVNTTWNMNPCIMLAIWT